MNNPSPLNPKEDLLLIFARNPELGKCKTRLAATIGDQAALEIYRFLLQHTVSITREFPVTKLVCYSDAIWENDIWHRPTYQKALQEGADLGIKMRHAFERGFASGFKRVVVIGTDMYDLKQQDLRNAFHELDKADYVVGPASDGGYYLLGMKALNTAVFHNKKWGESTVLTDTLKDLSDDKVALLPVKNDVDEFEDIKDSTVFKSFIKNKYYDPGAN